jgi:hypothetical protein
VLFGVGAVLLGRIHLPANARLVTASFRSRTWLWVVVVQFAFVNAAWSGATSALGPVVADDTIGRAAWGLVLAALTAGMFVGGLLALRGRWERPLLVGTIAVLLEAPLLMVLGLEPRVVPLLLAAFVAGVGFETFGVAWDVSMQSNIPADRLSRVYSYDWFGSLVFIPVGLVLAGPLSALVGVDTTIVGAGLVVIAATLAALAVPSVRNLRRVSLGETVSSPSPQPTA